LALIHDKDQPEFGARPPGPPDLKVHESIADTLRLARQELDQDLRTVAQVLCIRYAYLEAIEKSDFDSLPGTAYAIGFLRTYAEFLGLDGERIVERFKREVQGEEPVQELVFPEPVGHNRIPGGAIVLISMVLLAMAYGGWFYLSNEGKNVADLMPQVPERLQAMISGGDDSQGSVTAEPAAPAPGGILDTTVADAVASADTPPELTVLDTAVPAADLETDQEDIAAPGAAPETPAPVPEAVAEIDVSTPEIVETSMTPAPAPEAETVAAAVSPAPSTDSASVASTDPTVSVAAADPDPAPAAPMSQAATPSTGSDEPLLDEIMAIPSPPTATRDMALSSVHAPRVYGESDAGARIVLHAVQDSWVQIRDRQEALLLTRVLRSGDTYYVPDQDGLTLLTGNAGGIAIEVDGVALAPLGPTGEVRRQIALDPARLLDGTALPR
jgi:cytoskeleton protein RodZ